MHEIALSAGTVRYREEGPGDGPPVVFVHGFLNNGLLWRDVVAQIAGAHRCVVPDWPLGSHLPAVRPDAELTFPGVARLIAEFLAALDLRDVTLVGNDSGTGICQHVVTAHPERVGRLVLTPGEAFANCPPPLFEPLVPLSRVPGSWRVLLSAMALPGAARLPFSFGWLSKRPIPGDLLERWLAPGRADRGVRRDIHRYVRGIDGRDLLANTPRLRHFDRPVLLAWGREDRFFPLEHAQRLARIFPAARVEAIDDSRTYVALDQPARLGALIRELSGTGAGGGRVSSAGAPRRAPSPA